jgi:glyoxylase-like metal-dependent hydrolase (beta-lactamase superfamily II)
VRVSQSCFAVTGLGYSPPWYVNAGFIVGGHTTLIVDTGANAAAAATLHGYALAAGSTNQLRVVNTEKHFDHIGGNSYFRDLGIGIWGHSDITRTSLEFEAEIDEFNQAIPNPVRRTRKESTVFFENTRLANPNQAISSDMEWHLGDLQVQILLTPGHTPSNLSVWIPAESVLYTGDCLIRSYLPNLQAGGRADWKQWLLSLDRIRALNPRTVICGHGPVSRGDEVSKIVDEIEGVLREALHRGHPPTIDPEVI